MIYSSFLGRSERNGVEIEAVVIVALALGKSLHEKALKLQEAERTQTHDSYLLSLCPHCGRDYSLFYRKTQAFIFHKLLAFLPKIQASFWLI